MVHSRGSRVPGLYLVPRSRHFRHLRRVLPAGCHNAALFSIGLACGLAACFRVLNLLHPQQPVPPAIAEPKIVLLPKAHVPWSYDLSSTALYNGLLLHVLSSAMLDQPMAHNRRSRFPGLPLVLHSRWLRRLRRVLSAGCSDYVVYGIGIAFGLALSSVLVDLLLPQQQPRPATAVPKIVPPRVPHVPIFDDLNNTALYIASDWVAKLLHSRVRVLCWVLTHPNNIRLKARHVAATWGRRCTKVFFMSTKSDKGLSSALELSVSENRNALWAKTKASLVELYNKHYHDYDWFLKADDDTYVVMENLRFFLLDKDPSKPAYFGYPFRVLVKGGYVSGGSGYVLSREALRLIIQEGLTLYGRCRADSKGSEDVEIARCLSPIGIQPEDTRDALGRHRFFPVRLESFLVPGLLHPKFWLWWYSTHPIRPGRNCCSDTAASFHYIKPGRMYVYEFFVYHVRVLGATNQHF